MTRYAHPSDRPAPVVMAPIIAAGIPHQRRPGWLARFLNRLAQWRENAHQRQALLRLAPHLMKDIGVSQADIWLETKKPFWCD